MTVDKTIVRISVSNLYKKKRDKVPQGSRTHVPLLWEPSEANWFVLALDLPRLVEEQSGLIFDSLKNVQLCSYMLVRGIYTSDIKYAETTMPRDMTLPIGSDKYPGFQFYWLPSEPPDKLAIPVVTRTQQRVEEDVSAPSSLPHNILKERNAHHDGEVSMTHKPSGARVIRHPAKASGTSTSPPGSPTPSIPASIPRHPHPHGGFGPSSEALYQAAVGPGVSALQPDPICELSAVIGFSGEHARAVVWCPTSNEVVFPSNNVVIAQDTRTGAQRFLLGHTAAVVALGFSGDGSILATCQV